MELAAASVVAAVVLALGSAAPLLMRDAGALERHARRLLGVRGSLPIRFNEAAWRMVTESQPGPEGLALAVELAKAGFRTLGQPRRKLDVSRVE